MATRSQHAWDEISSTDSVGNSVEEYSRLNQLPTFESQSASENDDSQLDDSYKSYIEKFREIKLQLLVKSNEVTVLWTADAAKSLHINYLPYLLIMNTFNRTHKTILIISDVQDYFDYSKNEFSEHNTKLKSSHETYSRFSIGTIIKSDDIYFTKEYQKSLFQLTRSVNIIEATESIRASMSEPTSIELLNASDLMSVLLMVNNILYYNITHVLIGENDVSIYKFIRRLLFDKYGKVLNILEIPTLTNTHSSFNKTNPISLEADGDQIYQQVSSLQPMEKMAVSRYLTAMIDVFSSEQISFRNKFSSNSNLGDMIDYIRQSILLPSFEKHHSPIYVAGSFLTDQFHVLRKHWRKNVNKDDKSTGTGKGIDGLQANQKGFEPPLGGKFIIINWLNKEIVYTLDVDAPAGFFIEKNLLYIANNRLNYISIIDLIARVEIKRIDNSSFNCLHSLHRAENDTLLVTSTGIDAIIQINTNGETMSDWYATEHDYAVTPKGERRIVQRDFDHHQYIYPTLYQTTHINSAQILDADHFLATLFHQGLLVKIHRASGKSKILLSELHCPHAIKPYKCLKQDEIVWMLCNTKQNELLFLSDSFTIIQRMILEDVNWLQDASQLRNEHLIIADANHSRIIEIDPNSNTVISEFVYSTEWRIYQINDLNDFQTDFLPT